MGETFHLKVDDTSPRVEATLLDADDESVDLTGADVGIELREPRGGDVVLDSAMNIVEPEDGLVRYEWRDGDTEEAGRYRLHFVATYPDDSTETFPSEGFHDLLIHQ